MKNIILFENFLSIQEDLDEIQSGLLKHDLENTSINDEKLKMILKKYKIYFDDREGDDNFYYQQIYTNEGDSIGTITVERGVIKNVFLH